VVLRLRPVECRGGSDFNPCSLTWNRWHKLNSRSEDCYRTLNIVVMAARAPKPWKLTEEESFSSFKSWQQNLSYNLSCDEKFTRYLHPNATWKKATAADPMRGFTDDRGRNGMSAMEKLHNLQQMLGLITQWIPHYLATDVVSNSTSMDSIWQFIRKYYGFQQSETNFMKFSSISWEEGERPERLYQRVLAHLQDNLLCRGSRLCHDGEPPAKNEEMSPTVERLAVLRWMELIHPSLPSLVQRTFAHDLQRKTLKDLQPQIVDALDGFLEELRQDDVRTSRIYTPMGSQKFRRRSRQFQQHELEDNRSSSQGRQYLSRQWSSNPPSRAHKDKPQQSCRVCKAEGRRYLGHNFFTCDYVSQAEKRSSIRAQQVEMDSYEAAEDLADGNAQDEECDDQE